jgi:hypothetical protein
VDDWIDRLAEALDQQHVTPWEMGAVLKLARDVAHGVERKLAPLSAFVAGLYVGGQAREGIPRDEALARAIEAAARLIPPGDTQGSTGPAGGER